MHLELLQAIPVALVIVVLFSLDLGPKTKNLTRGELMFPEDDEDDAN